MDHVSAFNPKEYDEKIRCTLPFYEEYYKQVIDVVKVFRLGPLDWLDVGCGTGKMAELAYDQASLKRFVFNDYSSEMLETAQNRFDYPNAEFILSDVRKLEFREEFDVVTAIQVNHYFHEKDRMAAVKK